MSNISISKAALDKILAEKLAVGADSLVPRLLYYRRSYSTSNNGRTIEHGPGLNLSFIDSREAASDSYLSVDCGDRGRIAVGPSAFFNVGGHEIDWAERKFTLKTTK